MGEADEQGAVPEPAPVAAAESQSPAPPEDETITVEWVDRPTIFVDTLIGTAAAGGIARVEFGTIAFDPDEDAKSPKVVSSLTLVMHETALYNLAKRLIERFEARAAASRTAAEPDRGN